MPPFKDWQFPALNAPTAGKRTMAARLSDVINVKDWGAKGDNIQDDQPKIQAAINYAISIGGGRVFFPAGFYKVVSFALNVGASVATTKVELVGVGHGATTVDAAISKGPATYDSISRIEGMDVNGGITLAGDMVSIEGVFTRNIDVARASNVFIGTCSIGGGSYNPPYTPPHGPLPSSIALAIGDSCTVHNTRITGGWDVVFAMSGYGPSVFGSSAEVNNTGVRIGWAPSFTMLTSGSTATGNNVLTFAVVTDGKGFVLGRVVTHTNLPANTTITGVDAVAGTVTLSANATGIIAAGQTITFANECPAYGFTVADLQFEATNCSIDLYNCNSGLVTSCVTQGQAGADVGVAVNFPALIQAISWSATGFFGTGTASVTTRVNHNLPVGLSILQLQKGTVLPTPAGFAPASYNGQDNTFLAWLIVHVTTSASTSFEYYMPTNPGAYTADTLAWIYAQPYAMRCRKVHNTLIVGNGIGAVNAAYATLDLEYDGEAQHSNNVFGPTDTHWGIVLPTTNKQNLAGWKFQGVSGRVNPLEGIGGWTGKGGQATSANGEGNMRFADLPGQYTAQSYYQAGPTNGQEYLIKDSNIVASAANFNAQVTAGGSTNHVKVRFDSLVAQWKISG